MRIQFVEAHQLADIQQRAPRVVMALGYFDGVHVGHQKVILAAKKQAVKQGVALAVLSFFPHPKSVLQRQAVHYLEPIEQKAQKLEKLGVDIFYVVQFTQELAQLSPHSFVEAYVRKLRVQHIVCGFDYTYGHQAQGNTDTLAVYAAAHHIGFTAVRAYKRHGEKISSTKIREHVRRGDVRTLPQLLGTYYTTKYCQVAGVLPYYTLPQRGHYHVLLDTGSTFIPCLATVLSATKVQLHGDEQSLPQLLTIQWIEQAQDVKIYA